MRRKLWMAPINRRGAVQIYSANILRETKLHLDGFAARHSDAVKIMSATAAVAGAVIAPAASVAGLATHAALSYSPVQRKMTHAFDATMQRLGVDKFSREDLSEFASEAATFVASGIGAAKLPAIM